MKARTNAVRRAVMGVFVVLLALSCGVGWTLGQSPTTVQAASFGPGIWTSKWFMGAYLVAGTKLAVYCLEPGAETPLDPQAPGESNVSTLRGYWTSGKAHYVEPYSDPAGLRQMAYILHNFGVPLHTVADPNGRAAAVSMAIWIIRSAGDPWLQENVIRDRRASGAAWVALADQMVREAKLNAKPTPAIAEVQAPAMHWEGESRTAGTLVAAAGTKHLQLGGAVANGDPEPGVQYSPDRTAISITDGRSHTIRWDQALGKADSAATGPRVTGAWEVSRRGWPAAVTVFAGRDSAAQQQLGVAQQEVVTRGGSWGRIVPEPADFRPTLSTQVDVVRLSPSDAPADRVAFAMEAGSYWPTYVEHGERKFRALEAEGTLYGPLAQIPTGDFDPATLPVAAQVRLVADAGPGEYLATAPAGSAREVGLYTWVWRIRGADQGPELQTGPAEAWHLRGDYAFADEFGQPQETHVQPMRAVPLTRLRDQVLPIGGSTVARWDFACEDDGCLVAGNVKVPLVVRSTMYEIERGVSPQAQAPESSRVLARLLTRVEGGEARMPAGGVEVETTEGKMYSLPMSAAEAGTGAETHAEAEVLVPRDVRSGVTVQSCVLREDQPEEIQPLIDDTCDVWGSPEASAIIEQPRVETEAVQQVTVGESMHDVAKVEGALPEGMRTELTFTAYLQPQVGHPKFDANWRERSDEQPWTAAEAAAASCEAQPVATTAAVHVNETGAQFRSPAVTAQSDGVVYWVETLLARDVETGDEILLHRGECGLENERTIVHSKASMPLVIVGNGHAKLLLVCGIGLVGGAVVVALTNMIRTWRAQRVESAAGKIG